MDGCNTSRQQYNGQYRRIRTRIYRQTAATVTDRPTYGNKRRSLDGPRPAHRGTDPTDQSTAGEMDGPLVCRTAGPGRARQRRLPDVLVKLAGYQLDGLALNAIVSTSRNTQRDRQTNRHSDSHTDSRLTAHGKQTDRLTNDTREGRQQSQPQ